MASTFELRKRYNFSTKAPAILGAEYRNVMVESIMTADEAVKHTDILTVHEQIKVVLNLDIEATNCTFIKFKTLDGESVILALEYINSDSIVEVKTINIRVDILEANTEDILIIQERLKELGYANFKIRTFD